MPNAIGVNIVDSAQTDAHWSEVIDLVGECDMAVVTMFESAHREKALARAIDLRQRFPNLVIIYRKWRDELRDEDFPKKLSPQQWVDYMAAPLGENFYCATHNEAGENPMTRIAAYEAECIRLARQRGGRVCVFKVATGNPGGYGGEHLLASTDPRYRPDGYREMDPVWRRMAAVNAPLIANGEMPAVVAAPHGYYPPNGAASGLTDRHRCVSAAARRLGIDPHLIPLMTGESGAAYQHPNGAIDAERGYLHPDCRLSPAEAGELFVRVCETEWLPDNCPPQLYCLGETVGGWVSRYFNLLGQPDFWKPVKAACRSGRLRLPRWYGDTPMPTPAAFTPDARYVITTPGAQVNLRSGPSLGAAIVGTVPNNAVVVCHKDVRENSGTWWREITYEGTRGYVMLQTRGTVFTVTFQTVVEAPPPPREILVRPANAKEIAVMYEGLATACENTSQALRQQAEQELRLAGLYRQTAKLYGEE